MVVDDEMLLIYSVLFCHFLLSYLIVFSNLATKGTSLVIYASFEPLHIFHRRFVRAVRESQKHEIKKSKKNRRFISHIWREATAQSIATNLGTF